MELHVLSTFAYQMVLLALVLWAVTILARGSRAISVLLFIVLPVLILPLLLQTEVNGWFNLAKSLSIVFAGVHVTLMRVGLRQRPVTALFALLFLLNIVEVSVQDLSSGHWLNGIAAVLVMAMLPSLGRVSIDDDDEMVYPTSWSFIIAYSVWNLCFSFSYESVRGYRGDYVFIAAVFLLLPLIVALRRGAHRYTQARAYSLTFGITMIEATSLRVPEAWPFTEGMLYSPVAYQIASAVSLAVAVGAWAILLRRHPSQARATLIGAALGRLRPTRASQTEGAPAPAQATEIAH